MSSNGLNNAPGVGLGASNQQSQRPAPPQPSHPPPPVAPSDTETVRKLEPPSTPAIIVASYKRIAQAMKADNMRLVESLKLAEKDFYVFKSQIKDLEAEKQRLKSEIQKLKKMDIKALKDQLKDLQHENEELKKLDVHSLKGQLQDVRAESEELQKQNHELRAQNSKLEKRKRELKKQNEQLRLRNQAWSTTYDQRVRKLEDEHSLKEKQFREYHDHIVTRLGEEQSQRVAQMMAERDEMQDRFEISLESVRSAKEGIANELHDTERELAYVRMTIGEFLEMLHVLEVQKYQARSRLADKSLSVDDFLALHEQISNAMRNLYEAVLKKRNALRTYYERLTDEQLHRSAMISDYQCSRIDE